MVRDLPPHIPEDSIFDKAMLYLDVLRITSNFSNQYLASSIYIVRVKGLVYPLDIIF